MAVVGHGSCAVEATATVDASTKASIVRFMCSEPQRRLPDDGTPRVHVDAGRDVVLDGRVVLLVEEVGRRKLHSPALEIAEQPQVHLGVVAEIELQLPS